MKNVILSIVVISALIAGGIGSTFAGFVDTEESKANFIQAGILDLLVNGENDPDVPAKITFGHIVPCISTDFWIDLYSWSECQGAWAYMEFKNVLSVEAGTKLHSDALYVYDGTSSVGGDIPDGYKVGTPGGAGVASSEPELIAEEGGGEFGQYVIGLNDPTKSWQLNLSLGQGLGVDYASGIAEHLGVTVTVPIIGTVAAGGNTLGNPDTTGPAGTGDPDGEVSAAEIAAWVTDGNHWKIITSLTDKMDVIDGVKNKLGFLLSQTKTFIHVDVHLQQIEDTDVDCPEQVKYWPTNALQGDKVTWDMMFELNTD